MRSQRSGYNPICKECNQFLRKLQYRKLAPLDATVHLQPLLIYPLRQHNRSILKRNARGLIRASHVNDRKPYMLEITQSSFRIYELQKEAERLRLPVGDKTLIWGVEYISPKDDIALEHLIEVLQRYTIRLHSGMSLDI